MQQVYSIDVNILNGKMKENLKAIVTIFNKGFAIQMRVNDVILITIQKDTILPWMTYSNGILITFKLRAP